MNRILTFLRLVDDHDHNLSLTNIALIVVIAKLIFVPHPTVFDLGTLLLSLANYNAKKWMAPESTLVVQAKTEVGQVLAAVGVKT